MNGLAAQRRGSLAALAVLAALAGCAGRAPLTPPAAPPNAAGATTPGVRGLWRIDQARSEPIVDRRQARLDFGPDGRITGHTSCNTLSAPYTLEGVRLKVGPPVLSRIACRSLQLEQEDRILSALEAAASARVRDDGLLELRDADGRGVLRGTRFDTAR